jgi:hypothetical protein
MGKGSKKRYQNDYKKQLAQLKKNKDELDEFYAIEEDLSDEQKDKIDRLEEENKTIAELDKSLIQIEPLNEVEQIITPQEEEQQQIAEPEPAVESVEQPISDQVDTIIDSLGLNEEVEENSFTQAIEPELKNNPEQDIYTSSQHLEDNEDN